MVLRTKMRSILFGILPAVFVLAACSPATVDVKGRAIENLASKTPPSPTSSPAVESRSETEPTATAFRGFETAAPAEEPQPQPITLAGPGLTYQRLTLESGVELEFALLLPEGFNPVQSYPVLMALPPGGQTRDMVEAGLNGYWLTGADGRDWIVVSPVAPGGTLFFRGSEQLLPELLEALSNQILVEGDKYHLAGISNGGISAFRIATEYPELIHSMIVLPGFPTDQDFSRLERLQDIPVTLYVGEADLAWVQKMMETQEELERLQLDSNLQLVPLDGHVIRRITGDQIFDLLDSYR